MDGFAIDETIALVVSIDNCTRGSCQFSPTAIQPRNASPPHLTYYFTDLQPVHKLEILDNEYLDKALLLWYVRSENIWMKNDWKLWQDMTIISMDVGRIFWNPLCHRVSPFFNPTTTISPVLSLWHVSVEGLWYQQEIEQTNSITHGCRPGYWAKILWYSPISLKIHPWKQQTSISSTFDNQTILDTDTDVARIGDEASSYGESEKWVGWLLEEVDVRCGFILWSRWSAFSSNTSCINLNC